MAENDAPGAQTPATEPVRAADAATTPTQVQPAPQPPAAQPSPQAAPTTPAQPSDRDWKANAEEMRNIKAQNAVITQQLAAITKALGSLAPSAPAPAAQPPAPVAPPTAPAQQVQAPPQVVGDPELAAKFAFTEALSDLSDDYSLSKAQRNAVFPLFKSSDMTADALKATLDTLGIGKKPAPPTAAPAAPAPQPPPIVPKATTRSDTGPPGTSAGQINLANASEAQLLAMPEEDLRKLLDAERRSKGGWSHNSPFTRSLPARMTK